MAEVGVLSALGGAAFAAAAFCLKRYTGAKRVHCRFIMDDTSCLCGMTTDESEIKTKVEEEKKTIETELNAAMEHQTQLHEKDLELLDEQYSNAYKEMEADLISKNHQLIGLQNMLQAFQSDFRRLAAGPSRLPLAAAPLTQKAPPPRVQMQDVARKSRTPTLILAPMGRSRSSSGRVVAQPQIMSPRKLLQTALQTARKQTT